MIAAYLWASRGALLEAETCPHGNGPGQKCHACDVGLPPEPSSEAIRAMLQLNAEQCGYASPEEHDRVMYGGSDTPEARQTRAEFIAMLRAAYQVDARSVPAPPDDALSRRAIEIAQRVDDELLGATPPSTAHQHALTELLEGVADTLRALASRASSREESPT